jgi:hypothetical protein
MLKGRGKMLELKMDSNEKTSKRAPMMQEAVDAHKKLYSWGGFADLPVDVRVRDTTSFKTYSIELKEPADMVSSVLSGHLAKQILSIQSSQEPGCVVVLGSVSKTFDSIPKVIRGQYRGKVQLSQDMGRIRHFCTASASVGYPVYFYDMFAAEFILSTAYDYLTGKDVYGYLPKDSNTIVEISMLCMIPGIGETVAKQLYLKYGSIRKIMDASEEDLAETKINGKRLGKKASEIVKVFKQ